MGGGFNRLLLNDPRLDTARLDVHHLDAQGRNLDPQNPGEAKQRRLGGRVRQVKARRQHLGDAPNVDHQTASTIAAALLDEQGQKGVRDGKDAIEIRVEDLLEVREGRVQKGPHLGDARVVDEYVEAPAPAPGSGLADRFDGVGDGRGRGHVQGEGRDALARREMRVHPGRGARRGEDGQAAGVELARQGVADAAFAAACDED